MMVAIATVRATNTRLFHNLPFVAVFVGGTQGIGRYAVEALADIYSAQPEIVLRVYILGRRQSSADEVLTFCRDRCPHGEFTFVQAENLGLMEDVDAMATKIRQLEEQRIDSRIDLLVLTQAQILFGTRKETKEGLDQMMSLAYYSRIRFIVRLMPLLEASTCGARVVSVDAAGMEQNLFRDDLSLRNPTNYSYRNVKSHAAYMTTMAFEHLASHHDRVAFIYMYPGMVFGPSYRDPSLPWWFKTCFALTEILLRWTIALPPEESGHRILFLANPTFASSGMVDTSARSIRGTDGRIGSGCYAVGSTCGIVAERKHEMLYSELRSQGFQQAIWDHTMEAFSQIVAVQRLSG